MWSIMKKGPYAKPEQRHPPNINNRRKESTFCREMILIRALLFLLIMRLMVRGDCFACEGSLGGSSICPQKKNAFFTFRP